MSRRSVVQTGWSWKLGILGDRRTAHTWSIVGTHGASAMMSFWIFWYSGTASLMSTTLRASADALSTSSLQYHAAFAPPSTADPHERIGSMKSDGSGKSCSQEM